MAPKSQLIKVSKIVFLKLMQTELIFWWINSAHTASDELRGVWYDYICRDLSFKASSGALAYGLMKQLKKQYKNNYNYRFVF